MNTFIMDKMQRAQAQFAAEDDGVRVWKQLSNGWSDPTAARAIPAALNRTGAAFNRALSVVLEWDRAGRPGRDSSAHELCDDDQAALDSFMAGGL